MNTSKIAVDLRARTFEIEVPSEQVGTILDRLEGFFALPVPSNEPPTDGDDNLGQDASEPDDELASGTGGSGKSETSRKRARAAARPRSYNLVDLGLSIEQRQKLREEFESRGAGQQSDIVAVIGYLVKEITGKAQFSPHEIHSAIKIVNKPTPKNLPAVFGNMKRDGIADYAGGKVVINSLTDDYVLHHMAAKKKKK